MTLSEAIHDYRTCGRYELGHSQSTFNSYSSKLTQLFRWLGENGQLDPPIQDISRETIRRYSFHLASEGMRPRTIAVTLHAIRALWGYLVKQGVLEENAAAPVRMPKLDATSRKTISDEETARLLEATDRQTTDFRAVRDRAVLSVLIFGALRRQELLDLQCDDINLEQRVLVIQRGKGSKRRQIPLCRELHQALTDWMALRRTQKSKTERLFTIPGGRPLGEKALTKLVNDAAAIAGMRGDTRITPHTIRHNAATRMLRNGMDLKRVSVWLGHSELRTTAIYLHASEQELHSVADLAGLQTVQREQPSTSQSPLANNRSAYFRKRRRSAGCER